MSKYILNDSVWEEAQEVEFFFGQETSFLYR